MHSKISFLWKKSICDGKELWATIKVLRTPTSLSGSSGPPQRHFLFLERRCHTVLVPVSYYHYYHHHSTVFRVSLFKGWLIIWIWARWSVHSHVPFHHSGHCPLQSLKCHDATSVLPWLARSSNCRTEIPKTRRPCRDAPLFSVLAKCCFFPQHLARVKGPVPSPQKASSILLVTEFSSPGSPQLEKWIAPGQQQAIS